MSQGERDVWWGQGLPAALRGSHRASLLGYKRQISLGTWQQIRLGCQCW